MRFDVVTLFPDTVDAALSSSIVGRARKEKIMVLGFADPRVFTQDRHRTVDDRPYGGGPGMLMMAEPLHKAVKSVAKRSSHVVLLGPRGRRFDHGVARELARKKHVVLVCGHYEGVDERVRTFIDEEISIGDYILTGGELAAAVVVDSVTRFLPGVFKKEEVPFEESFTAGVLEAPQYTRPAVWKKHPVPQVLLSGNHKKIEQWRKEQALILTKKFRPDLLKA